MGKKKSSPAVQVAQMHAAEGQFVRPSSPIRSKSMAVRTFISPFKEDVRDRLDLIYKATPNFIERTDRIESKGASPSDFFAEAFSTREIAARNWVRMGKKTKNPFGDVVKQALASDSYQMPLSQSLSQVVVSLINNDRQMAREIARTKLSVDPNVGPIISSMGLLSRPKLPPGYDQRVKRGKECHLKGKSPCSCDDDTESMVGRFLFGIPKCMNGFKDLKYVRGNTASSDSIYNLDGTSIKEIEVFGKDIKNLDGLYGIKTLEKLVLLESDIERFSGFPDSLGTLKKLQVRTSKGIFHISPMKATKNLTYLELDGVSTRSIKDLGDMPNLRRLKLDKMWRASSQIGEIEDITGIEKYQKLVELDLGGNDVKLGVDGIFKLPSLKKLTITQHLKSDKRFNSPKNASGDPIEVSWR